MSNLLEKYLEIHAAEVSPMSFYRDLFPKGSFEERGFFEKGKYNGIAVLVKDKKIERYTITDELGNIKRLIKTNDFCLMSPISYVGKERKSNNARHIYAMAIDLDGLKMDMFEKDGEIHPIGIVDLFWQMDGHGPSNYLPKPTYIVSSGTGLHIYYFFDEPIPLFPNIVKELEKLKKRLTWQYWTQGLLDKEHRDSVQFESLFQGFRMVGGITKVGTRVRAFKIDDGSRVNVDYLNKFVPEEYRAASFEYKSKLRLSEAKDKYPYWYEKRIVNKQPKGTWQCKRDLYDWWLRRIREVREGHRYWSIMTLATYAKKCGISRDELEKDAFELIDFLDEMTSNDENHFTQEDVTHALEAYNDSYITYPIDTIVSRTDIPIKKNKRNGRKQVVHLMGARALQEINDRVNGKNWRENNGRPKGSGTAQEKVIDWRLKNPSGRKIDCERETGLSRPTVLKWWEYVSDR